MSDAPVLIEREGAVLRLTLNRPDKLNSLTVAVHEGLRAGLDIAENDTGIRCLLLTGAGRAFCAGQDLNERVVPPGAPPIDLGETVGQDLNPLVARLHALPIPVIAAVNGVAAGAGASIALAADLVLAARSARFTFTFTKVGLGPDGGASWILPRLVGAARAAGLAFTAEPVGGEDAAAWGLVWKCLDDAVVVPEAAALAQRLAKQPREALAAAKRALQHSWSNPLGDQLELERETQQRLGFSDDYREGLGAFLERRTPTFG